MRRLSFAILSLAIFSSSAIALDKSEFTAEINKLWKIKDQNGEAAHQKLLAREDLTEGQIRFLERSLINYRHNKGDDMTGAMQALEEYIAKYPNKLDRKFLSDMDFKLGQYIATAGRVAGAREYSDQLILDTWNLGYWVDALVAYMNSMSPIIHDLKADMVRTGYLCFHDGNSESAVIPYSVNEAEKPLMFCPQGTYVKINSPQPYQKNDWQKKIGEDHDRAQSLRAEIKLMMADLPE